MEYTAMRSELEHLQAGSVLLELVGGLALRHLLVLGLLHLLAQAVQRGLELVDLLLQAAHRADLALQESRLRSTLTQYQMA
jgi:hypothetical protein